MWGWVSYHSLDRTEPRRGKVSSVFKKIRKAVRGPRPQYSLPGWSETRGYDLHLPPSHQSPMPLVIAIHGYTQDGRQMSSLTSPDGRADHPDSFNSLADAEGFAVAYPYGTRIKILPGRCWNAGGGINGYAPVGDPARRHNVDDVGFFEDLFSDITKRCSIDLKRVYLMGISNGGAMAQRLAVENPQPWAAIATVSACNQYSAALNRVPQTPMPLIHIHGTEDKVWPYLGKDLRPLGRLESVDSSFQTWLHTNQAELLGDEILPAQTSEDPTRIRVQTYRGRCDTELFTVQGGGHTWPSGFQYLPPRLVGVVSRQMSANTTIWEFFKRHRRD